MRVSRTPVSNQARAAHQRVWQALKRGEIVRPSTCSECGAGRFIQAAHRNYSERLAIRWLCRPCHARWDHAEPKGVFIEPAERVSFNRPKRLLDFVCPTCGVGFQRTYHASLRQTPTPCCSHSCRTRYARALHPERFVPPPSTPLRGSASRQAKLTEAAVVAIRADFAAGGATQTALAARWGVSAGLVGKIVRREAWTHV